MAKVLGLGGIFFKAADGDALSDWYRRVLGFEIQDGWGGAMWPHPQQGFTLWSPFKADTTYFEPSAQPFMINLIVDDLDGVLARAKDAGVEPLGREEGDANGQFAWLLDPAGVKVELWQPPAGA
ncbi:VOC family protein [Caulobacter sp. 17J80-11]|uniref:VOC family protein n=1 Tax=Caulobacter sp. 17J80-11 TaxID=2763502 RepID=UPI0016538347|nr:VOC family protein [Caulobacter sp. 17J80-11]MBC6980552.1 VOC family protein [Caulobacter sp. 17J80-11]